MYTNSAINRFDGNINSKTSKKKKKNALNSKKIPNEKPTILGVHGHIDETVENKIGTSIPILLFIISVQCIILKRTSRTV